jgi:hypothetical protein
MTPVKRIILSCLLAALICQLSFVQVKKQIDKYQNHSVGRLTELLYNKTAYDVLFIGSSRTHLDVNPRIIDSICKVNSYNAGIEGANLFEFNMMLHAYLQNHPAPHWLVLTLDLHSFAIAHKFFNYAQYFSFTQNSVIEKYLNNNGHSTLRVKLFPFLEMTDYDDNTKGFFLKGLAGDSEIDKGDFQYKGYLSNTDNCITSDEPIPTPSIMPTTAIANEYLADIVQTCNKNNIKLIFTYAPEYKREIQTHISNSNEILNTINSVAIRNNIPFFRDDSLSICSDPTLFANAGHLNRNGATIYSTILAKKIDSVFLKDQSDTGKH